MFGVASRDCWQLKEFEQFAIGTSVDVAPVLVIAGREGGRRFTLSETGSKIATGCFLTFPSSEEEESLVLLVVVDDDVGFFRFFLRKIDWFIVLPVGIDYT